MLHANPSRRLALVALLSVGCCATVMAAPAAADPCTASGIAAEVPAKETLYDAAASVVREVNRERVARGLMRLGADPALALAARRQTRDMVRRGFFSHVTPDGRGMTARVQATGYLRNAVTWALGETLAWGSGSCSTPAATVAGWMNSPTHRRVLLGRRYRELGAGVELGTPLAAVGASGVSYAAELGVVRP